MFHGLDLAAWNTGFQLIKLCDMQWNSKIHKNTQAKPSEFPLDLCPYNI